MLPNYVVVTATGIKGNVMEGKIYILKRKFLPWTFPRAGPILFRLLWEGTPGVGNCVLQTQKVKVKCSKIILDCNSEWKIALTGSFTHAIGMTRPTICGCHGNRRQSSSDRGSNFLVLKSAVKQINRFSSNLVGRYVPQTQEVKLKAQRLKVKLCKILFWLWFQKETLDVMKLSTYDRDDKF